MWQTIIVFLIVLAAGAFLVKTYWPSKKSGGPSCGCSGSSCSGCPGTELQTEPDEKNNGCDCGCG